MRSKNKLHGIIQTKELLDFVFSLVTAIDKSLEDGKIDYSDIMNIIPVLMKSGLAFKDIDQVPKELGDLDKEEIEALKMFVEEKFDISNDKIEKVVKVAFDVIFALSQLLQDISGKNK